MKRFLQGFAAGLAVLVVLGMVTTAAFGSGANPSDSPSPATAPPSSETPPEAADPSESETREAHAPEASRDQSGQDRSGDQSGVSPDFSPCSGQTGLENAACRHEALLKVQPNNAGLANALAMIQANAARHATDSHATAALNAAS
jgi:hypothetical protein